MTAREALRTARATMEHMTGGPSHEDTRPCAFYDESPSDSPTYDDSEWTDETAAAISTWHASLVLDGFSIEEVTNAGG